MGPGTRQRLFYLLAVINLALGIGVSTYIWLFGGFGVAIGLAAGAGNYGILIGFLGTATYTVVVGEAAFLSQPMPNDLVVWVIRGSFVLFVATLGLLISSYLIGVGIQIIVSRRF